MLTQIDKQFLVDYHIASRRTKLTTEEGYDFAFAPEGHPPPTACWRYDKRLQRHNILFGAKVDEMLNRPKRAAKRLYRRLFLQRVYDHEGAHSLFTTDMDKVLAELKRLKIPFVLWNLFEDARIEACWRKRFHVRFHWLRFVLNTDELPKPVIAKAFDLPANPQGLFLDCKNLENSYKGLEEWLKKDKEPKVQFEGRKDPRWARGRRFLIRWYYRWAIRSTSSLSVIKCIESWLKTFPLPPTLVVTGGIGEDISDIPGDPGEMPDYAEDADGSEHEPIEETIRKKTKAESRDSYTGARKLKEEEEDRGHEDESRKLAIPFSEFFSHSRQRHMNFRRAQGLIRLFEKYLEGGEGMIHSRSPSSRIDFRKLMRGAEDIYLRKGEDPLGVKEISFILDCSGSMARALEDGVYLAYVLNELVRRRKIECRKMILCGGRNQAIPMPFDARILDYLQAPGSIEGFAEAMREHEKDLVRSDLTIFFTDGEITDEHIHKSEWHRRGVYTIGLFCGNPSRSAYLHRWFDSVLVRDTIESVADSLIQIMKR